MYSLRSALQVLTSASLLSISLAANVTVYQQGVSFLPNPLPAAGPASHCDEIIRQFNQLGRTTVFNLVKKIPLEGDTGEPEGMINIGEQRYLISSGQYTQKTTSYGNNTIINGTDRTPGVGFGHLLVYDANGKRIANASLSQPGDLEYHIGGIDYDGKQIWGTVAQYRPNTTATIISLDPQTMNMTKLFHAADHLGGIVHDPLRAELYTLNWGARNSSVWDLHGQPKPSQFTNPQFVVRNPSFYVDYQDCKWLGRSQTYHLRPMMMCSGVATFSNNVTVGGLAIVDVETMVPVSEIPLTMVSDLGVPITQNPFDVDIVNGHLRLYFVPDQKNSTLYVYEPVVNSPYEY